MSEELYLGDGLYASFDGWQIRLRAPRYGVDHEVFLEPEVYQALIAFGQRCWHLNPEPQPAPVTPDEKITF